MTRRTLLRYLSAAPFLARYHALAAPEKRRTKIRDLQTMVVQGPRTYTLVKVVADDGLFGIGEAYGSPAVGVKEQVLSLKAELVGRDPLEIDTIYTTLGEHTPALSGTRTDGSAHMLLRAVSGIEMALWDLSGRILNQPVSILLGGRFRDRVRMYDHAAPKNMLDPASVRDWAQPSAPTLRVSAPTNSASRTRNLAAIMPATDRIASSRRLSFSTSARVSRTAAKPSAMTTI